VPEPVIARAREILSNLEAGEREAGPRFAASRTEATQLGLFSHGGTPAAMRVVDELRAVDPLTLMPIEALQKLYELVEKAKS
jgi:DNA mismatch repair protein MutS